MTLHKLSPEKAPAEHRAIPGGISITHRDWSLDDAIFKDRVLRTFASEPLSYPICRSLRCTARATLEGLFDDLALATGLVAQRPNRRADPTLTRRAPGPAIISWPASRL